MSDLGVQGLRHFIMPPRILSKRMDAKDIDFGPDPGAEQPSGSSGRPSRAPSARFKAAVAAAQESDSDHPNRKKRKRKTRTWKGKSKATQSELEDSAFSSGSGEETEDSEADAKITNEGLNGLDQHLKSHAPDMCRFYEMLNSRDRSIRPSDEEIEIARGEKKLRLGTSFSSTLAGSLREAFARSGEKAAGPWDQAKFEELLVEWLVACDQPFQEVERPELRRLLEQADPPSMDKKRF
ncbi:hypothetical protein B0H10DRAFT_2231910 [Mycena sp. CBHHK59/15]|nr:hypothetical protein B0H10DRAFT_2231910 [Mycena sp. CBHHK59/15]